MTAAFMLSKRKLPSLFGLVFLLAIRNIIHT